MAEPGRVWSRVTLDGEDRGHESFGRALIRRVAADVGARLEIQSGACRGGEPALLSHLKKYRRLVRAIGFAMPDILVVLIDANADGASVKRRRILEHLGEGAAPRVVVGCPEPYIERWMFADPSALSKALRAEVRHPGGAPDAVDWKGLLGTTVAMSGIPISTGPMEIAPDVVKAMDFQRAMDADRSFESFLTELRSALRALR